MTADFLQMNCNPKLIILYEDPCILAVNKPAGQLFQGHTKGLPQTLDSQLKGYIRQQKPGSDNVYLGIVHRLDRPVSGVVVFGRNSKFAGRLGIQFQERLVEKHYTAIVEGVITADSGILEDDLSFDAEEDGPLTEDVMTKRCYLGFTVIHRSALTTTLDITLGTGRRNQIRRQLQKVGYPVLGDIKFGATNSLPGTSEIPLLFRPIALHASALTFAHPKTDVSMTLRAGVPSYWPTP